MTHLDKKVEGELYASPADDKPLVGWHGVFAGCPTPPKFVADHGGYFDSGKPPSYINLPLTTRLNIDRLYNRLLDEPRFVNVHAVGDNGSVFKINPMTHYSPYRISATIPGTKEKVIIGVSDHEEKTMLAGILPPASA